MCLCQSLASLSGTFWKIALTALAVGTFKVAATITEVDDPMVDPSGVDLPTFGIAGAIAYCVCFICYAGPPPKDVNYGCLLIALLPEVMVVAVPVAFLAVPALFLLGIFASLTGPPRGKGGGVSPPSN